MKNKISINVNTRISLEDLSQHILDGLSAQNLDDKNLAKWAVSLGEGGDGTYELELIKQCCDIITSLYSEENSEDHVICEISKKLKEISELIKLERD